MSRLCMYFGVEMPDPEWAASLADTDVVLEPYHPLAKEGGFAEAFPNSRRWIYVNPTSVDPWLLEQSETTPPLIGYDERWKLPRLDLEHPEALEWAVDEAMTALASDGGRIHGLFVDDLDRLLPDLPELAMDFLVQVAENNGGAPRWFLNRAFSLWPLIENLEAVLLEDITPELMIREPEENVRWLREVVLPNVEQARNRGVRIHSLGYLDQEGDPHDSPDITLQEELTVLVDSVTTGADRALNEWRISA